MKRITTLLICTLVCISAASQEVRPYKVLGSPSGVTPYFFGPNAFPVPDMVKNTVSTLRLEAGGQFARGRICDNADYTATSILSARIPLWSDRVELSFYGQVHEWFWDNEDVRSARLVSDELPLKGDSAGDAYFSLDARLVNETGKIPALTLRIALKTASGDKYEYARYYDAPGYHFDLCATKHFNFGKGAFVKDINFSADLGFLCWQIDLGCQNDALMYGLSAGIDTKIADIAVDLAGYSGIERYHDKTLVFKARARILPGKRLSPVLTYQRGLRDWPFDTFGAGLQFNY